MTFYSFDNSYLFLLLLWEKIQKWSKIDINIQRQELKINYNNQKII